MTHDSSEPPRIAGPVPNPTRPMNIRPRARGRCRRISSGPPIDSPMRKDAATHHSMRPSRCILKLLERLGCAHGLIVQGNAHGYDNCVLLDALAGFPSRLRGIAITDKRALRRHCALWGADWSHPSIAAEIMPDDGHLLDLFRAWTPDAASRRCILVETPGRLFGH